MWIIVFLLLSVFILSVDNYTIVFYFVHATVLLYITKIILFILTNVLSIQMRPLHPARFFFTDAPDLETLGLKKIEFPHS